ncbi:MAG: VanW family protein [Microthrixaceae bacterium]
MNPQDEAHNPVDSTPPDDPRGFGERAPRSTALTATLEGGAAPTTEADAVPREAAEQVDRVRRARPRRWPRRLAWVLGTCVALLAVLVGAWAIDTALAGDSVPRNTELAGRSVGGMAPDELTAVVEELATELPDTEVVIEASDLRLESSAGELGLGLDAAETVRLARDADAGTPAWQRPFEWAGSFVTPRAAPVAIGIDEEQMDTTIEQLEGDDRSQPVEPAIVVDDGSATLRPGVDGVRLDPAVVAEALPSTLPEVGDPIVIQVERTVVAPGTSDEEVDPLVEQANTMATRSTTVRAGQQSFEVDGAAIIGGVSLDLSGDAPRLVVDDNVVGSHILEVASGYANPTGVTFTLGNGGLVPVAGRDAEVCCGEGATGAIVQALLDGAPEVEVPTRTMTAAEGVEWASTLGVERVVSEFTTPHKCCQGRVTNIHTIADRVRGTLIPPGSTFSVNDLTGRRTTDKGYVPAPAIVDGEHVDDVGGGVSQFATTLFNAAFFAGLPIPEYKMHSEYISRYPYAREATLFYPSVDLKVRNDTPYGIVIFPTYTDTSVTVQLWSTPYARGEETGKSKTSGCGSVTTTRTITYPDRERPGHLPRQLPLHLTASAAGSVPSGTPRVALAEWHAAPATTPATERRIGERWPEGPRTPRAGPRM